MGAGRWAYVGLRFDGSRPDVPDDWTPTLRAATGLPDLAVDVLDVQRFTLAAEVATTYRAGPGFLVGDAAHRTTPVAGIGLNTAIHDGHELGWKLAWAARGLAGDALLASHDAERGPVGLAAAARSLDVQGRPTDGLPSALGHTHRSPVIAGTEPAPDLRIDLAARPGERAPHAWVRHAGRHRSTLDLFDGTLTLLTGADGRPWARAARAVTGVPFQVLVDGRDVHGVTLAARYGLRPGTAVLVRPDGRVAWRHDGACADRVTALTGPSTRRSAAWPSPPHWPADISVVHHRWPGRAERARWPPETEEHPMIHPALLHVPTPNWAVLAWSTALRLVRTPAATRRGGPAATRPLPPGSRTQQRPRGGARVAPVAGRHRGRHRHAAVRARIRGGRARRRDGRPAQRRPGARPDAARPARPALVPAAAFHRHRTGGGARRVARARPGHAARPRRARRAVARPGRPPARRHDHHRPARNAGAPGERVAPAGRTGAHAGRGPRTGVVRTAVRRRAQPALRSHIAA